jgi:acyl dehydratase
MTREGQTSIVRSFTQADFDCFARLSGDDNPIHVDAEFSARSRFGRTVAHGLLLCSVLRGLIEKLAPGGRLGELSVRYRQGAKGRAFPNRLQAGSDTHRG